MLERQKEMVARGTRVVRENPAPAMLVVGLGMLLIAVLAGGALYIWTRKHKPVESASSEG